MCDKNIATLFFFGVIVVSVDDNVSINYITLQLKRVEDLHVSTLLHSYQSAQDWKQDRSILKYDVELNTGRDQLPLGFCTISWVLTRVQCSEMFMMTSGWMATVTLPAAELEAMAGESTSVRDLPDVRTGTPYGIVREISPELSGMLYEYLF